MTMKYVDQTLSNRIWEFQIRYGGLRAAARQLQVSASYLVRLRDGWYDKPSDKLLRRLRLKREVRYVEY